MTENEAIKVLTDKNTDISTSNCDDVAWRKLQPAVDAAISALKEVQQYRALGSTQFTKDELSNYDYLIQLQRLKAESDIKELNEYRVLGTVEELREAIERRRVKKPIFKQGTSVMAVDYADGHGEMEQEKWADWVCPNCGWFVGERYIPRRHDQRKCKFCSKCGQAIDWSKEE